MIQSLKKIIVNLPVLKQLYKARLARLKKEEEQQTKQKLGNWNLLFKNSEYQKIKHKIANGIEINLYKDSVLSRLIYEGDFEKEELDFISKHLQVGDCFIDIGTNIGLYSLIASKIVGTSGKVIGFEPSPKTYDRLTENLALSTYKNYEIKNIGISDKDDFLNLNLCEDGFDAWDSFAGSSNAPNTQKVKVAVSTLDHELQNIDKSKISLVKIDVEGWEKFVLLGAKNFLTQYSPTLLIEFTEQNARAAGYDIGEVYDIMVDWGYKWYEVQNGNLVPSLKKKAYPYINLIAKK